MKTTIGNSYGASQQLKNMPAEYRTFVSPQFLAGGSRALENNGSESWAGATQITPEEVQTAKQWQLPVAQGGKGLSHAQAVAKVREMGIRPDGVEPWRTDCKASILGSPRRPRIRRTAPTDCTALICRCLISRRSRRRHPSPTSRIQCL